MGKSTTIKTVDSPKKAPAKVMDFNMQRRKSRSRSSSIDSRISIDSRRSISPLDDSRIRRSVSPLDDSRLQNSRLDDSRRSRRSSFDDSRLRSPVSSPLGSKRSSSRSLSPLSPTHETSYTLAATPGPKKGKGKATPASKQAKGKVTPSSKTPATKRGRASPNSTPRSTTRSAKKSRVNSPEEKSLKLQLSETL